MRFGTIRVVATCFLLLASSTYMSVAQPAPPGQDRKPAEPATRPVNRSPAILDNDGKPLEGVSLASADVHAIVRGPLAEAIVTLTFANSQDRVLGGELTFPLPDGATVSGYGLDVNGVMVDGVAVEKQQARVIYETEMRKTVDPGLVEHVVGNNFRTRLYPIPARGERTVKVRYVMDLVPTAGRQGAAMSLPLGLGDNLKKFDLTIAVEGATEEPTVRGGTYANKPFQQVDRGFYLKESLTDAKAIETLTITLPEVPKTSVTVQNRPPEPVTVEELEQAAKAAAAGNAAGPQSYFVVTDTPTMPRTEPAAMNVQRLLVVWDASLSRKNADVKRELSLLEKTLARLGYPSFDVVLLRNDVEVKPHFGKGKPEAARAIEMLTGITYDGGTNLGSLSIPKNLSGYPVEIGQKPLDYDFALLFTDGIGNLGQDKPAKVEIPVWAISGDSGANHNALRSLCQQSGGAYLNLNRQTDADAIDSIGQPTFSIIGIEADKEQVTDITPSVGTAITGRVTAAGRLLADEATVTFIYGYGKTETSRQTFTIRRTDASDGTLIARYWAQQKVNELSLDESANRDKLLALGRQYHLVTPATSLLVLETVEQYVQYGIVPPKNRPDVYAAFIKQIENRRVEQAKTKEQKIEQVLARWNERVAWWEKSFNYPKDFKYVAPPGARQPQPVRPEVPIPARVVTDADRQRAADLLASARRLRADAKPVDALQLLSDAQAADPDNEQVRAEVGQILGELAATDEGRGIARLRDAVHVQDQDVLSQLNAARQKFDHAMALEQFEQAQNALNEIRVIAVATPGRWTAAQARALNNELTTYDLRLSRTRDAAIRMAEAARRTAEMTRLTSDRARSLSERGAQPSERMSEVDDLARDIPESDRPDGIMYFAAVRIADGDVSAAPRGVSIQVKPWDPATPYISALRLVPTDDAYDVYLAQRDQYVASPAFYFDCANYLAEAGRRDEAIRVLTNVLELKLKDARLIRIVAHRLQQLGELDLAISLFEEVTRLRPEEPQSFRDLALALAARADDALHATQATPVSLPSVTGQVASDYARALDLLNQVVTGNWQRFEDIELIALMEANRISAQVAAIPHLGDVPNPIDPRLRKNLDCDIRIVLTWDADATDIDLWVTEPSGEVCMYDHNRTTIGGGMSRDFTQGYGPEEYFLRNRMPGQYTIQANFYGSRQQELTGACTVQATVITNFGRPDEARKQMTLRLTKANDIAAIGTVTLPE